jgi:predicted site-specific integrase-resolvase
MIKGRPTIADAAKKLDVCPKTIREWITKGVIDEPPVFQHGTRPVQYFPDEFIEACKRKIRSHIDAQKRAARRPRSRPR